MPEEQVAEVTETTEEVGDITDKSGIREPKPDSIEAAVSRLMGEPEKATSESEPEETTEQEETEVSGGEDLEESEAEPDGEEETEEEETPEGAPSEEELDYYLIKVDGEEIEVTLEELRSGYQRQKDYTKKTQSVAEERKAVADKQTQLDEMHQNFLNQAQLANELLNRDLKKFESVDWETLKTEDPVGYVQKQIEKQEIQQQQANLRAQAQQVYEHNLKSQQEDANKYLEAQRKESLKLFPDWKDTSKRDTHQNQIIDYARNTGYQDQELANIINARDLLVLDKARQWDDYMKTKGNIPKKKTAPAVRKVAKSKGKAPVQAVRQKSIDEKSARLRKSGSLRDAASLMEEMRQRKQIAK